MYYTLRTIKTLLVVALIISAVKTGFGQNLETMQPFDMVVPSTYGGGTRPNEGFYFGMDFMAAWISAPDQATIGSTTNRGMVYYVNRPWAYSEGVEKGDSGNTIEKTPTMTVNPNDSFQVIRDSDYSSYTTSMFTSGWVCARRYDVGYMWGHHGLGVSIYDLNDYSQSYTFSNAKVAFDVADKAGTDNSYLGGITTINGTTEQTFPGNEDDVTSTYVFKELGIMFDSLTVSNNTSTGGVELNYTYRFMPRDCFGRRYGIWELDFGVRYLQFKENYNVYGVGSSLADSWWNTSSTNNIIGPQIAARYFRTFGRWTFDFQTKFLAGFNNQNVYQDGSLGVGLSSHYYSVTTETENDEGDTTYTTQNYQYDGLAGYPGYVSGTTMSFNHSGSSTIFSPVVEFRFNAKLQLTQLLNLRMGYTCMYVGNIARASEMVEYTIPGTSPAMGINMGNNKGDSLVHGFTIGLEVNR